VFYFLKKYHASIAAIPKFLARIWPILSKTPVGDSFLVTGILQTYPNRNCAKMRQSPKIFAISDNIVIVISGYWPRKIDDSDHLMLIEDQIYSPS